MDDANVPEKFLKTGEFPRFCLIRLIDDIFCLKNNNVGGGQQTEPSYG